MTSVAVIFAVLLYPDYANLSLLGVWAGRKSQLGEWRSGEPYSGTGDEAGQVGRFHRVLAAARQWQVIIKLRRQAPLVADWLRLLRRELE
jgi:hypothetical protein